jgi:hypothetical protein
MARFPLKTALAAGIALAGVGLGATTAAAAENEFCIMTQNIRESRAVNDHTILVRMIGNKEYRKISLSNPCSGITTRGFAYESTLNRLCRSDVLHVLETAGAICTIDRIEQITEAQAKELQKGSKG